MKKNYFTEKFRILVFLFLTVLFVNPLFANPIFIDKEVKGLTLTSTVKSGETFQLFSHGRSGELLIDGKWLDAPAIAEFLKPQFRNSKFVIRNLNIYGCEFAKGFKGLQAVAYLQAALGISVSASTNITGIDGDWNLEIGNNKEVITLNNFNGNLQDTDGDGISDAIENGCTGTYQMPHASQTIYGGNSYQTQFATGLPITNVGLNTINNLNDKADAFDTAVYVNAGTALASKTILEVDFPIATSINKIELGNGGGTAFPNGATYKIEAWDGSAWVSIVSSATIANLAPTLSTSTQSIYFSMAGNTTAYFKYRIVGLSGTTAAGGLYEAYITLNCTGQDTDGDGIINRLDLDSDNDGCSDAIEGAVNYATYALDPTIEVCKDSDADSVKDYLDLDDDNDGVLDTVESSCLTIAGKDNGYYASPASQTDGPGYNGLSGWQLTYGSVHNSYEGTWGWHSPTTPVSTMYDAGTANYTMEKTIPTVIGHHYVMDVWVVRQSGGDPYQQGIFNILDGTTVISTTGLVVPDLTSTSATASTWQLLKVPFVATSTTTTLQMRTVDESVGFGVVWDPEKICDPDFDTDGDHIPNRLDLDSDNDGCSDANEYYNKPLASDTDGGMYGMGAPAVGTTGKVTAATYIGEYGNVVNFTVKTPCDDYDGDGVNDVDDLDDDNDGILDAVESLSCFYTAAEAIVIKSIYTDMLAQYIINPVSNVIDANLTNYASFDGPRYNDSWIGKAFVGWEMSGSIPISKFVFTLTAWGFTDYTAATYRLEGSNNLADWTPLSTSSSSAFLSVTLTNTLAPNVYFKYYRIAGLTDINYLAGLTKITPTLAASYIPSSNPKPTCTGSDTDGDGIPNYRDLDSDNDGCTDAIEGGASFASANLFDSSMPGGNVTHTSGTYNLPVVKNLGNTVGNTTTTMGVPTIAGSPQTIGTSTDAAAKDAQGNCPTPSCPLGSTTGASQYAMVSYGGYPDGISNNGSGIPNGNFLAVYSTGTSYSGLFTYLNSFTAGAKISLTAAYVDTRHDGIFLEFSRDKINWTAPSPLINTFTSSLSVVNYTVPLSFNDNYRYVRVTGNSDNSYVNVDAIQITDQSCDLFAPVTFLDNGVGGGTANNCIQDGTEASLGSGSGLFYNFIQAGVVVKSVPVTIPTIIGNLSDGTYTMIITEGSTDVTSKLTKYKTSTPSKNITLTSGIISPTSIIFCLTVLDSDGDGISDDIDLDDDNDGILDTAESNPVAAPACNANVSGQPDFWYDGDNLSPCMTCLAVPIGADPQPWISTNFNKYSAAFSVGAGSIFNYGVSNGCWLITPVPATTAAAVTANAYSQFVFSPNSYITMYDWKTFRYTGKIRIDYSTTPTFLNPVTLLDTSVAIANTFTNTPLTKPLVMAPGVTYYVRVYLANYVNDGAIGSGLGAIDSQGFHWRCPLASEYPASLLYADKDTDGDGIPDRLDLDSDGDGCTDAFEGGSTTITASNLVSSTMPGGNTGAGYTGTSTASITQNLGSAVGSAATTMGVPTVASTGQTVGTSIDGVVGVGCPSSSTCTSYPLVTVADKGGITVSSDIALGAGSFDKLVDGVSVANTYFTTTSGLTNKSLFAYNFETSQIIDKINILADASLFSSGTTYQIQGLTGSTWSNIGSSASVPAISSGTYSFPFTNTTSYNGYRILVTGGVTSTPYIYETNFNAKVCPVADPCAVTGAVGSTAPAGDYDGDGINNTCDLDDDNDGILDTAEATCTPVTSTKPTFESFHYYYNGTTQELNSQSLIDGDLTSNVYTGPDGIAKMDSAVFNFKGAYTNPMTILTLYNDAGVLGNSEGWRSYTSVKIRDINGNVIYTGPARDMGTTGNSTETVYWNFGSLKDAATITFYDLVQRTGQPGYGAREIIANTGTFTTLCRDKDTDGDSIPDYLDLDSDADGCSDAWEGGMTTLVAADLKTSTLPGGNVSNATGVHTSVQLNLGNTVGSIATTMGVPTIAGTGQAVGNSTNFIAGSECINPCSGGIVGSTASNGDYDGDGVTNSCDLDDDNDGILDTDEVSSCVGDVAASLCNGCLDYTSQGLIGSWQGNGSAGNEESVPIITSMTGFSSNSPLIGTLAAGTGQTQLTGTFGTSLADAKAIGSYVTFSFTTTTGRFADIYAVKQMSFDNLANGYSATWSISSDNINFTDLGTILIPKNDPTGGAATYPSGNIVDKSFSPYYLEASKTYTVRIYVYDKTLGYYDKTWFDDPMMFVKDCADSDTDGDGIPNRLDLDSDNDGCSDAIEGGASFILTDLVSSPIAPNTIGIPGGNSPQTSGTYNLPVVKNLGNTVGAATTTMGVPTIAGTGQTIGTSKNAALFDAQGKCITCNAGVTPPTLSATTKTNVCPATTVDLTTITSSNTPANTVLEWHTGTPATSGNKVTTPTAVPAGTYYAVFYDATNTCYSNTTGTTGSTAVTVTIDPCCAAGYVTPTLH